MKKYTNRILKMALLSIALLFLHLATSKGRLFGLFSLLFETSERLLSGDDEEEMVTEALTAVVGLVGTGDEGSSANGESRGETPLVVEAAATAA